MALITASNLAALQALAGLQSASIDFSDSTRALSTGKRVERPSDDPGGYFMAERLSARQKSFDRLQIDAQTAQSLVQTANSGIDTIIEHLGTIRTLALSSASGAATTADRQANETQVQSLIAEITSIGNTTFFNSKNLLDGTYAAKTALTFQVGPDQGNTITLNIRDMRSTALGVNDVSVSTQALASGALDDIDSAITVASTEGAKVAVTDSRIGIGADLISSQNDIHKAAIGGILDADLAEEVVKQAEALILRQTASSALAQANLYPQSVLAAILPSAR